MRYRMVVKEIKLDPIPYAIADIDILVGERVVVDFRDLGVQLAEKGTEFRINREFLENPESKKVEIGPSSSADLPLCHPYSEEHRPSITEGCSGTLVTTCWQCFGA